MRDPVTSVPVSLFDHLLWQKLCYGQLSGEVHVVRTHTSCQQHMTMPGDQLSLQHQSSVQKLQSSLTA